MTIPKPLTKKDEVNSTIVVPLTELAKSTIEIPIIREEWDNKKAYLTENIQSALKGVRQDTSKLWEKHKSDSHFDAGVMYAVDMFTDFMDKWFPVFKEVK